MNEETEASATTGQKLRPRDVGGKSKPQRRRRIIVLASVVATGLIIAMAAAAWLGTRAAIVKSELEASTQLIPMLKEQLLAGKPEDAAETVNQMRSHTAAARDAVGDPLWTLASAIPGLGGNFSATAEVARSADDVVTLGVAPLVRVFESLEWQSLVPGEAAMDLEPMQTAAPSVMAAAQIVRVSAMRLESIDTGSLWREVAVPIESARDQLKLATTTLDAAATAAQLAPSMLGSTEPRRYLLLIQNNAEARATGGIPGALAVLNVEKGRLSLSDQTSATDVGAMSPVIPVEVEQQQIYSGRVGKFMQDINLTPDFPTSASTAKTMWERKTGESLDGVISIDPVALGFVLDATGPVQLAIPELLNTQKGSLPSQLTGKNVVKTLLSDVYNELESPAAQDFYFASVARETFGALASGKADARKLLDGLARGVEEGRVLVWSASTTEQALISKYALSGSIIGPSISPAQFGVYFNDGTGAKMDYYVNRTVQLSEECSQDGYEQTTVRVTSTNSAPADAALSLPPYVTGAGAFGIPQGSVQTNIIAYGPIQANIETAKLDGQRTDFASHRHSNRPVGVLAVRLAPGESHTVEFTFGKIVQHSEPNLVVTPTVQPVKDVILPTEMRSCGQ